MLSLANVLAVAFKFNLSCEIKNFFTQEWCIFTKNKLTFSVVDIIYLLAG